MHAGVAGRCDIRRRFPKKTKTVLGLASLDGIVGKQFSLYKDKSFLFRDTDIRVSCVKWLLQRQECVL
jgi:hypothetical protein